MATKTQVFKKKEHPHPHHPHLEEKNNAKVGVVCISLWNGPGVSGWGGWSRTFHWWITLVCSSSYWWSWYCYWWYWYIGILVYWYIVGPGKFGGSIVVLISVVYFRWYGGTGGRRCCGNWKWRYLSCCQQFININTIINFIIFIIRKSLLLFGSINWIFDEAKQ